MVNVHISKDSCPWVDRFLVTTDDGQQMTFYGKRSAASYVARIVVANPEVIITMRLRALTDEVYFEEYMAEFNKAVINMEDR